MKLTRLAVLAVLSVAAVAQTGTHTVAVTWTASPDSTTTTPGTVNVWRASGACTPPLASFVKVADAQPAAGTFNDTNLSAGQYCYFVTAVIPGFSESAGSAPAGIGVVDKPSAPPPLPTLSQVK